MRILKGITNYWILGLCIWTIAWRCVVVMVRLNYGKADRKFINRFAQIGARKVLQHVKASYQIQCIEALNLHDDSIYIFMSNHQSLLDIPLIFATIPGTVRMLAKQELFNIPLFGKTLHVGECLPVNRFDPTSDADFFQQAFQKLKSGIALWIFPEGSRSKTEKLLPFKAGVFRLAREAKAKIIPVGISGTRRVLSPESVTVNLHQHIEIRVGSPIDTQHYDTFASQKQLMQRVYDAIYALQMEK